MRQSAPTNIKLPGRESYDGDNPLSSREEVLFLAQKLILSFDPSKPNTNNDRFNPAPAILNTNMHSRYKVLLIGPFIHGLADIMHA